MIMNPSLLACTRGDAVTERFTVFAKLGLKQVTRLNYLYRFDRR